MGAQDEPEGMALFRGPRWIELWRHRRRQLLGDDGKAGELGRVVDKPLLSEPLVRDFVPEVAVEHHVRRVDGDARAANARGRLARSGAAPQVPEDALDGRARGQLAGTDEVLVEDHCVWAAGQRRRVSAGGGLVTVEVDGHMNFRSVSIDPKAIDPDDVSLLEDLVLAALRDAAEQLQAGQSGAMGGLDLGGLGGLLGGE